MNLLYPVSYSIIFYKLYKPILTILYELFYVLCGVTAPRQRHWAEDKLPALPTNSTYTSLLLITNLCCASVHLDICEYLNFLLCAQNQVSEPIWL